MATTYIAIATTTVGVSGAATITFSSIPQIYTDLLVKISTRSSSIDSSSGYYYDVTFNGTSSNRSGRYLQGNGTNIVSGSYTLWGVNASSDFTSNTFSNGELYIPNYTSSNNKSSMLDTVQENNATLSRLVFSAGLWSDSSAITSITFTAASGNFVQYSTATLYGIKNS